MGAAVKIWGGTTGHGSSLFIQIRICVQHLYPCVYPALFTWCFLGPLLAHTGGHAVMALDAFGEGKAYQIAAAQAVLNTVPSVKRVLLSRSSSKPKGWNGSVNEDHIERALVSACPVSTFHYSILQSHYGMGPPLLRSGDSEGPQNE